MKKKLLWFIKNIEEIISVTALSSMVIIASFNVFFRYAMNDPITWAEELEVACLIWATFLGAAVCYKRNMHYGMDYLVDHLPIKGKRILRKITTLLFIFLFSFLTYLSFIFAMASSKTTTFFRIDYTYLDFAAVMGFASMAIYSIIYFVESFVSPKKFDERYAAAYEDDIDDANEDKPKEGNTV